MADEVRAAGAVLWRVPPGSPGGGDTGTGGLPDAVEVAVIHRPRYDDWSLPKGKLDPGEDDRTAAVREIEEETACRGEITGDLGEIRYPVERRGRMAEKVVRYFVMRPVGGSPFTPNDEVDELRWLPPEAAAELLSYARDRDVLARFPGTDAGAG